MTLMNKLPYLVDLFVRIPAVEDPACPHIILHYEGGHPRFLLPSPLPSPDELVTQITHHLFHILLEHPHLDHPDVHDPAWHLALDSMVDQLTPPEWRRFAPSEDPATMPDPAATLFQDWTWFASHPDQVDPNRIMAIEEHQHWRHLDSPIRQILLPGQPTVAALPEKLLRKIAEHHQLIDSLQWRTRLTSRSAGSTTTRLTWTHHQRSRRYGTYPGVKIQSRGELAIILDTSGSMDPPDIRAFFEFLPVISRIYGRITMVEADHQVRAIYPYRRQVPRQLTGRGDTFFQPAIDEVLRTLQPDAIWYVTDGQGPPPRYSAPIPLTWLICGDHAEKAHLRQFPGNYLYIKNKPATSNVTPV